MSNLTTLIKVNLRETLDKRKFKENKKQQAFLVYVLLLGLLFICISSFYSFIYAIQYKEFGMVDQIFNLTLIFFIATTILTFSSTISKMQSIFMSNDYDILSALPVSKRDIVISKIINLYIIELIVALILLVPNSIVSTIISQDLRFLIIIPLAFIAPAFSMLFALFITAILEILIKNQKVKTIISTVLTIAILGTIFVFGFISGMNSKNNGNVDAFNMMSQGAIYINPTLIFLDKGFKENLLWLLVYVGINIAVLVLVLSIVVIAYNRIHNNMVSTKLKSQTAGRSKNKNLVFKSQFKQFMSMTSKNFFKSKNALMQTFIGIILSLLMGGIAIVMCLNGAFVQTNPETNETINVLDLIRDFIFVGVIGFTLFSSIMPPSSVAVSLEGKNFNVLKTLPINFKTFLKSKLLFSFLIMSIPSFILSVAIVILIKQSIFSIIISLIFPIIFTYFISAYTLFINASMPYLNWKEEIEVYKYHKSTIITVFTDMGISMVALILAIVLGIFTNAYVSGIAIISIFVLLSILFTALLFKKTAKKLETLEVFD